MVKKSEIVHLSAQKVVIEVGEGAIVEVKTKRKKRPINSSNSTNKPLMVNKPIGYNVNDTIKLLLQLFEQLFYEKTNSPYRPSSASFRQLRGLLGRGAPEQEIKNAMKVYFAWERNTYDLSQFVFKYNVFDQIAKKKIKEPDEIRKYLK